MTEWRATKWKAYGHLLSLIVLSYIIKEGRKEGNVRRVSSQAPSRESSDIPTAVSDVADWKRLAYANKSSLRIGARKPPVWQHISGLDFDFWWSAVVF